MGKAKIVAVSRAGAYSPNHIGNDAAVLNAVVENLRKRGFEVVTLNEDQFLETPEIEADCLLAMCRKRESIRKMQDLEDKGMLVINSGYGIENCTREKMTRLLLGNGIPYPQSLMVDTDKDARPELLEAGLTRCWIKRGDFHAMHKEDVTFCRHPQEVQETLHEFFLRGIRRAVINKHLEGDLVKFYGLGDGSFFYWFYPLEAHHSKFNDENINGMPSHFTFDEEKLKHYCKKASEVCNVPVYGGDVIIDAEGGMQIIDFNDWPSFAPCREDAAPKIAKLVANAIKGHSQKGESDSPRKKTERRIEK